MRAAPRRPSRHPRSSIGSGACREPPSPTETSAPAALAATLADHAGPIADAESTAVAHPAAGAGASVGAPAGGTEPRSLAPLLRPGATAAVRAEVLPTMRLLLPKGVFIDCTLETAIDSTLPGMTTYITATDTFGVDGKVVLLERGTKLVGEVRGQVEQGSARRSASSGARRARRPA